MTSEAICVTVFVVLLELIRLLTSACTLLYVALSTPKLLRRAECPLPCLPSITSDAIVEIDFEGFFGLDLTPARRLTSARTFSYLALDIPSDLRRLACPLPCLPAITSEAICATVFVLAGVGFFEGLDAGASAFSSPVIPRLNSSHVPISLRGQFFPLQCL